MIPEVNHLLFHISKGRFYQLALMGFCSLCDHPDPRRDRGPFSTLQLSKLNALFESAQCPFWVGSTPLVSRLKWRFELRGNDLADPNNDKCLCMCHAMTVYLWSAITSNVRESFRMAIINCYPIPLPCRKFLGGKPCHLRMKSLSDSNSNIRESFRIYLQMEIFIAYQ